LQEFTLLGSVELVVSSASAFFCSSERIKLFSIRFWIFFSLFGIAKTFQAISLMISLWMFLSSKAQISAGL